MVLFARLDPALEKEFRIMMAKRYGGQKGALEKALQEAIKEWLKQQRGFEGQ